ncbi:MAG: JAB domain-containing protein, partial [Campylobacterota bacterium]|nr:JAB domain-containing protein [Campylobacterota bacterium]
RDKKQEYFLTIYLDGANHICETRIITIGTLNQSLVHPREVFAPAVENRCASIIVAHNHPSGVLKPSREDLLVTKRLKESGKLLGIELLDHVIIGKDGFIGLKDNDMM